jgi:hypothetical protein
MLDSPRPASRRPREFRTRIRHANELHEVAKRYLSSVPRPTIDLGRTRWAGSKHRIVFRQPIAREAIKCLVNKPVFWQQIGLALRGRPSGLLQGSLIPPAAR